jgi:DNA-binding transcriptional ArsR family regulator
MSACQAGDLQAIQPAKWLVKSGYKIIRKVMSKKLPTINEEQLTPTECAKALRAIGDQTRIRILKLLMLGEQSVLEIAEQLNLDQPHVSHHLAVLRNARLVYDQRDGKRIIYSIHPAVKVVKRQGINLGCCKLEFTM